MNPACSSLVDVPTPPEIMSRLKASRTTELEQMQDLEHVKAGLTPLAEELYQRSELLGTCVQRLGSSTTTHQQRTQSLAEAVQALSEKDVKQDEAIT